MNPLEGWRARSAQRHEWRRKASGPDRIANTLAGGCVVLLAILLLPFAAAIVGFVAIMLFGDGSSPW